MSRNIAPTPLWVERTTTTAIPVAGVHLVDDGSGIVVFDDTGPATLFLVDDGSGILRLSDSPIGAVRYAAANLITFFE